MKKRILILTLAAAWACEGQVLPGMSDEAAKPPAKPVDPLGRETPKGTVLGFIRAAQRGKYQTAAMYLQLAARQAADGPHLAAELQAILDHGFPMVLDNVSPKPGGDLDDGLATERDRAGIISLPEGAYDLILARIEDPTYGPLWLIGAETIRQIPEMHRQVVSPWLESHLPKPLVGTHWFGVPVWQWIMPFIVMAATAAVVFLLWALLSVLWRLRRRGQPDRLWWKVPVGPVFLMTISLLTMLSLRRTGFGLPALHRYYYGRAFGVVVWICAGWLLSRAIDRLADRWRRRLAGRLDASATSLLIVGRRFLQAIVITAVGLAILSFLGFNVTTLLAGVGIGGIAIALAAQKTLENVIGGMTILTDQVLHVGDDCNLGGRVGTVEDISLRSTRLRTAEGTLLAIPNGALAMMNIENLTGRQRFLFRTQVGVRYETTSVQLQAVLEGIREILARHPHVEKESCRARFLGFGPSSLDIEVFMQILATNFQDFARHREEVLFEMMRAVENAGTSIAFPSQTVYLSQDEKPGGKSATADRPV